MDLEFKHAVYEFNKLLLLFYPLFYIFFSIQSNFFDKKNKIKT
jgi:hypothetical protein